MWSVSSVSPPITSVPPPQPKVVNLGKHWGIISPVEGSDSQTAERCTAETSGHVSLEQCDLSALRVVSTQLSFGL